MSTAAIRFTVLVDNQPGLDAAGGQLRGEHGLSLHIEHQGRRILLDAGASELFAANAARLHIDLKAVELAVLSHGHYDHGNGLPLFLAENTAAPLYLRPAAGERCYHRQVRRYHYIGLPPLDRAAARRIVPVTGPLPLAPDAFLVPHTSAGLADRGQRARLYRRRRGRIRPDDFAHEQSLVFNLPPGLVIFNSCCHGGVENIIAEVQQELGRRQVYALIGGFHLMGPGGAKTLGVSPQEVRTLAERLLALEVAQVYTGHCSGEPAVAILAEVLGERFHPLQTGLTVSL